MKTKEDIYKIVEDACFWGIPKRLKSYILDAMELNAKEALKNLGNCYVEVKCEDELPTEDGHYITDIDSNHYYDSDRKWWWDKRIKCVDERIKPDWWLKKPPPHPKEEPKDSGWISVEDIGPFAKWREDNRWFSFEDGKWKYTFEHGTAISNKSYKKHYTKTTTELFQMYGDSIKTAGLPPTVETKKD